MGDYRNSPTIKFDAELFLAHRCPSILERASENWSNLLTSKASVTFCQINWTVCKRWKRNSEKFQLPIKCFLMVDNNLETENVFRSKLCKSNWNSAWNLAFPVFTLAYIVRNMCENLHYESVCATQRPRILLTDNMQSGGSCSVNYYMYLGAPGWGLNAAIIGWTMANAMVTIPRYGCGPVICIIKETNKNLPVNRSIIFAWMQRSVMKQKINGFLNSQAQVHLSVVCFKCRHEIMRRKCDM